jgi:NAD(P)H-nitrite reductase large subunit
MIEGRERVERAVVSRLAPDGSVVPGSGRVLEVDTVCLGFGFVPSIELLVLAGCGLVFDGDRGGWLPKRNATGETDVAGIFAVGDGAGIGGARLAELEGRVAGVAAAERLGRRLPPDVQAKAEGWGREIRRCRDAQRILGRAYAVPPAIHELSTPDTVVCRCEEVTRGEIVAACRDGSGHIGQVKAWTRIGMGPCQGRICAPAVRALVAHATGQKEESVGYLTPRPPVKPLPAAALLAGVDVGSLE